MVAFSLETSREMGYEEKGNIHFEGIFTIVQDVFDFSVLVGNLDTASNLSRSKQFIVDAALLEDLCRCRIEKNGRT